MRRIDGGKDSALTWGDLYGMRNKFRNSACESRLSVQKSADAIVRRVLEPPAEGLNMKYVFVHQGVQGEW
jgi:hypothetical protein